MNRITKIMWVAVLIWTSLSAMTHASSMNTYANVKDADIPASVKSNPYWEKGFLDITQAPYSVVPNSASQASSNVTKIHSAISDAYNYNLVVWFPAGKTYYINSEIYLPSPKTGRKWGNKLVGGGNGSNRAVIKVVDGSLLAGKYALKYEGTTTNGPAAHYSAELRNINIDMGNNPDASAVHMNGAQHCVIEDVRIFGTSFNVGIHRLPGSGGNVANLHILGGKTGILQDDYRPNPTIQGLTLDNQSDYGILITNSRGPVTVTGGKIISPAAPTSTYRAVLSTNAGTGFSHFKAGFCLVDMAIEVKGTSGIAIETYLSNIMVYNTYIKSATLARVGQTRATDTTMPAGANSAFYETAEVINGDPSNYKFIPYLAFSGAGSRGSGYVMMVDSIVKHTTQDFKDQPAVYQAITTNNNIPADLLSRHLWDQNTFPYWDPSATNLVDISLPPYNAVRDLTTADNTAAIQSAIDFAVANNKVVFIPRGYWYIKSKLTLKSGLKMIGAANAYSVINLSPTAWAGGTATNVGVDTENSATGPLTLGYFCIQGYTNSASKGTQAHQYVVPFALRTNNTIMRDIQFERLTHQWGKDGKYPEAADRPFLLLTQNAGGKIYASPLDFGNSWKFTSLIIKTGEDGTTAYNFNGGYSQYLIKDTVNQLNIYQPDTEYVEFKAAQIMLDNAKKVNFFGFKYEDQTTLLEMKNGCDNISIIGGSGNYSLFYPASHQYGSEAIIKVSSNCTNYQFAGLDMQKKTTDPGYDPAYILLKDLKMNYNMAQSDMIAFYRVGNPTINNFAGAAGPSNLLTNGNFEQGLSPWVAYASTGGAPTVTVVSGGSDGGNCARITDRDHKNDAIRRVDILTLLQSNGTGPYIGTAYIRHQNAITVTNDSGIWMKLFYRQTGGTMQTVTLATKTIPNSTAWTIITGNAFTLPVTPSSLDTAYITFETATNNPSGVIFIDDVFFGKQ